jgi:hypothetical protein
MAGKHSSLAGFPLITAVNSRNVPYQQSGTRHLNHMKGIEV